MYEITKCDHCNESAEGEGLVTRTVPTGTIAGRATGRSVKIHRACDLPWLRSAHRALRSKIDAEIVRIGGAPPKSRGLPAGMDEAGERVSLEEAMPVLRSQLMAAKRASDNAVARFNA